MSCKPHLIGVGTDEDYRVTKDTSTALSRDVTPPVAPRAWAERASPPERFSASSQKMTRI
jgi:hypothetical protein